MKTDKWKLSLNCKNTFTGLMCVGTCVATSTSCLADQYSASVQLTPPFSSAWQESVHVLWQNAPSQDNAGPTMGQVAQSLQIALAQDALLNEQQQFNLTQNLPAIPLAGLPAHKSSVGVNGGDFSLYATAPLPSSNQVYNPLLSQINPMVNDQSQLTCLQWQPLKTKTYKMQVIWANGQQDLDPTSTFKTDSQFLRGNLWGFQGSYQLPMLTKWNFNGQWVKSNLGQSNGATSWQTALSGPVHHPLGTTQLSLAYTNVDPNYESFADIAPENGSLTKALTLSQPLGQGDLKGNIGLSWSQIERENNLVDLPNKDNSFNGTASLRWQLAPSVTLTANHSLVTDNQDLFPGAAINTQQQQTLDSSAGMEIKVSPTLLFNLGAGVNSEQIQQQTINSLTPTYDNNSNYLTVGIKNSSHRGSFGINLQRNFSQDALAQNYTSNVVVNLNAQQKLAQWLQVGGTLCLTDNATPQDVSTILSHPANLSANAQLSLKSLGALQLTYSQWDLQNALDANNADSANAYQISYLLGARNGQSGLGISVAYSYSAANNPQNATWQLGLTYR